GAGGPPPPARASVGDAGRRSTSRGDAHSLARSAPRRLPVVVRGVRPPARRRPRTPASPPPRRAARAPPMTVARACRIAVLELLVSSQLGGGPAYVEALLRRLDPAEFAVTVGAPAGGPFLERFRAAGADVVEVAADRLSPRTLARVGQLIR